MEKVVLGVSGGLDSPRHCSFAAASWTALKLPRTNILAFTLPRLRHRRRHQGQRAGARERGWRVRRKRSTSVLLRVCCLPISSTPLPPRQPVHDVTFENVQAGLRTDYLFRFANCHNALVVGTRRPFGVGSRLVYLRGGRSYVSLQC
ncbi:hypothetical protein ACVOMV_26975 (plasmid) [Mesorhizobium atlanticum]|uniref:hypothetical protein n=1 Tax=Mesorhizobium atlanticum TaxID=2233532 RepID=UPI0037039B09